MDRTVETGFLADVPARVGNRAIGGSNHVLDPEVLDDDEVEVPYQLGRGRLDPVPPAVRLFGCQPGHAPPGVCPSVGALLLSGELTLQPVLPLGLTGREQGRNPKVDPIGGGDGGSHPHVQADLSPTGLPLERRRRGGEADVPPAGPVQSDSGGGGCRYLGPLSRDAEPNPSSLGDLHFAPPTVDLPYLEVSDVEALVDSGPSPGGVGKVVGTLPPVLEGPVEVPEGGLLDRRRSLAEPGLPACLG